MKNILRVLIITGIIAVPLSAFAQTANITGGLTDLSKIVTTFNNTIVRSVAALLASLAMVAFFYGIVQFIWGSRNGKPEVMTNGKNFMLWGLIALFVMFSVWGIVRYFQGVFSLPSSNTITIPSIQSGSSGFGPSPSISPTQTNPFRIGNTPNPYDGGSYSCSPGYECTLPGGAGIGLCNSAGNACVSNAISPTQTNPFNTQNTQTNPFLNADCSVLGSSQECGGGLTCVNYKCQ